MYRLIRELPITPSFEFISDPVQNLECLTFELLFLRFLRQITIKFPATVDYNITYLL